MIQAFTTGERGRGGQVWDFPLLQTVLLSRSGHPPSPPAWMWDYERGEGGWGRSVLLLLPLPPSVWTPLPLSPSLSLLFISLSLFLSLTHCLPSIPLLSHYLSAAAPAVWTYNSVSCRACSGLGSLSKHPGRVKKRKGWERAEIRRWRNRGGGGVTAFQPLINNTDKLPLLLLLLLILVVVIVKIWW